jgi:hypothetical protein
VQERRAPSEGVTQPRQLGAAAGRSLARPAASGFKACNSKGLDEESFSMRQQSMHNDCLPLKGVRALAVNLLCP